MVKTDFTGFTCRSEEKKIAKKRLNTFIGLSTCIVHNQVNRSGVTLLKT